MYRYIRNLLLGTALASSVSCNDQNFDTQNAMSEPGPDLREGKSIDQVVSIDDSREFTEGKFSIPQNREIFTDSNFVVTQNGRQIPVYQIVSSEDELPSVVTQSIVHDSFQQALPLYFGEHWQDVLSSDVFILPVKIYTKTSPNCTSLHASTGDEPKACVRIDESRNGPNSGVVHEAVSHAIVDNVLSSPYVFAEGLALLGSGLAEKTNTDRTFTHPYYDFESLSTDGMTHSLSESGIQLWYTLATQYGVDVDSVPTLVERIANITQSQGSKVHFSQVVDVLEEIAFEKTGTKPNLDDVLLRYGVPQRDLFDFAPQMSHYVVLPVDIDIPNRRVSVSVSHSLEEPLYLSYNVKFIQGENTPTLNQLPISGLVGPNDAKTVVLSLPAQTNYDSEGIVRVEILDVNGDYIFDQTGRQLVIDREIKLPPNQDDLSFRSVFNYVGQAKIYGYICNEGGLTSSPSHVSGSIINRDGEPLQVNSSIPSLRGDECATVLLADMVNPSRLDVDLCVDNSDYDISNNCQRNEAYQMGP